MDSCERLLSLAPNAKLIIASDINQLAIKTLLNYHSLVQIVNLVLEHLCIRYCACDNHHFSKLLPVPKESPLTESNQLRPISLTNIIVRLFERAIYITELVMVMENTIHKYHPYSSTMALIKSKHTWIEWLDSNASMVRVFSFDFSKAFDTVPHEILCNKLTKLPISPDITNWIINFLTNRYQPVVVDGVKTEYFL